MPKEELIKLKENNSDEKFKSLELEEKIKEAIERNFMVRREYL